MPSKFETRIATQRYHGISSRDWFRLTDAEQAALTAEAVNGLAREASDRLHAANIAFGKVAHRRGYGGSDVDPEYYRLQDACMQASQAWERASREQGEYFYPAL